MERMLPRRNERMSMESRVLCGVAGGALLIFGVSRRSWLREPLALGCGPAELRSDGTSFV